MICLIVGAQQHAAALLPQVKLSVEVDRVDHFLAGFLIDLGHFGHVFGQKIHVLHGQDRKL